MQLVFLWDSELVRNVNVIFNVEPSDMIYPASMTSQSMIKNTFQDRCRSLDRLEQVVRQNTNAVCESLKADLGKHPVEALTSEIAMVLEEIHYHKKHLKSWMKPKRVGPRLSTFPSKNRLIYEPRGRVLIIGPWNYPFQLVMLPLVGALAAGNTVVVKPSEIASNTEQLVKKILSDAFPPDQVSVVVGGQAETTELLKQKFDAIFFTGSTAVGKVIMTAAAKTLTPVTLELGGKSPVIVTDKADLELAAKRIVWGKFYNAGQTCIAPDYVLVHQAIGLKLAQELKKQIQSQYGENPKLSESYGRIINQKNVARLQSVLQGAQVFHGGESEGLFFAPTLVYPAKWTDHLMQDEIFGPLLPILEYQSLDQAFDQIKGREKPLAAYLFSKDKAEQDLFMNELSFGGACINDTLMHLSHPELPFGGVGSSGLGSYHGFKSFETFSHQKSIMIRGGLLDFSIRYPPYTEKTLRFFKRFLGL